MKAKSFVLGLIFLALIACEKGIKNPYSPDLKAYMVLDGELNRGYLGNDSWGFNFHVKNVGRGTGYDCMVEIQCFSDVYKTTLIDTAYGFPASFLILGDIVPGQRVRFEVISYNANSMDDLTYTSIEITWKDRWVD